MIPLDAENSFSQDDLSFARHRLNKKRDIELVFSQRDFAVKSSPFFLLLVLVRNDNKPLRCCISIKKKLIKRANVRNRLKRLIRESIRIGSHSNLPVECILLLQSKCPKDILKSGNNKQILDALASTFAKLERKFTEYNIERTYG